MRNVRVATRAFSRHELPSVSHPGVPHTSALDLVLGLPLLPFGPYTAIDYQHRIAASRYGIAIYNCFGIETGSNSGAAGVGAVIYGSVSMLAKVDTSVQRCRLVARQRLYLPNGWQGQALVDMDAWIPSRQ